MFSKDKVVKTCMRMGATSHLASVIADKVESKVYNGMPTDKLLQLIFRYMHKEKPGIRNLFDLRKGLSLMSSKPEFETFVQVLLSHNGFKVSPNQILKGRCVEHEVDAIARRDGVTYFVEAKHHNSYHSLTGLDENRIARALLEDVIEGFQSGNNDFRVDKAMIVTNTRYSEHPVRYGRCRDIMQIDWNYPIHQGLENIVEEKRMHPLSCLKSLRSEDRIKLVGGGFVSIMQLLTEDPLTLARKTGLPRVTAENIIQASRDSANTLGYY